MLSWIPFFCCWCCRIDGETLYIGTISHRHCTWRWSLFQCCRIKLYIRNHAAIQQVFAAMINRLTFKNKWAKINILHATCPLSLCRELRALKTFFWTKGFEKSVFLRNMHFLISPAYMYSAIKKQSFDAWGKGRKVNQCAEKRICLENVCTIIRYQFAESFSIAETFCLQAIMQAYPFPSCSLKCVVTFVVWRTDQMKIFPLSSPSLPNFKTFFYDTILRSDINFQRYLFIYLYKRWPEIWLLDEHSMISSFCLSYHPNLPIR